MDRFVRTLPKLDDAEGFRTQSPRNQSRFDCIHIVPAPAVVAIDGDLSEWDRSGLFVSRMEAPYGKHYYVEGCMMYSDRYLYIGAHVGDPVPMQNAIDLKTDTQMVWRGGSVQVRISTSRELGWPLQGRSPLDAEAMQKGFGRRPQDVSENLVHLTMWYHRPTSAACLMLQYGLDLHRDVVNPSGAQGAFRKDSDGQGYTLEYAIPWSLLSAGQQPPHGGETFGACWQVHWGDETGRVWKGHLVDITRVPSPGITYQRADDWGAAIYHPGGHLSPGTVRPRTSILD